MNNKALTKIVLIFLILFFFLLCLLFFLVFAVRKEDNTMHNMDSISTDYQINPQTVEEVILKYESEYINQESNIVYVNFSKDLYNEAGGSNKNFFFNIVDEVSQFFEKDFYLVDEKKDINIYAKYDSDTDNYSIIINDIEDFFENTDGKSYIEVETSKITDGVLMSVMDNYLEKLQIYNSYFSHIEEELGEGEDLGNDYKMYLNKTLKLRTVPTGAVKNIVFLKGYEGKITSKISAGMTLKQIKEVEPQNDFGGINKGYLGYRQNDFYFFFYDDEISVYTYSYKKNTVFEGLLEKYIETKDLDAFVNGLSSKWKAYDSFEYNKENKSAKILYSTRGVNIDIDENDPKGITFYNNYYFTDYTKSLVKNGKVSFDGENDLVELTEIERRKND